MPRRLWRWEPLGAVAGTAAWLASQGFEGLQSAIAPAWDVGAYGGFHLHGALAMLEETAEMPGSLLFVLALLILVRSHLAPSAPTANRSPAP